MTKRVRCLNTKFSENQTEPAQKVGKSMDFWDFFAIKDFCYVIK